MAATKYKEIFLGETVCEQTIDEMFHDEARHGRVSGCEALIDYKADVNAYAKDGTTPLIIAAMFGNINTVGLLIENKADPELQDKGISYPADRQHSMRAVVWALTRRHEACAVYLLQRSKPLTEHEITTDLLDLLKIERHALGHALGISIAKRRAIGVLVGVLQPRSVVARAAARSLWEPFLLRLVLRYCCGSLRITAPIYVGDLDDPDPWLPDEDITDTHNLEEEMDWSQ